MVRIRTIGADTSVVRARPRPVPQHRDDVFAPLAIALFEGETPLARQIRTHAAAVAQEFLLRALAPHGAQQPGEEPGLLPGDAAPLGQPLDQGPGVHMVGGLHLDEQVVADEGGFRGGGREALQLREAGVGDAEQTLVGPAS